MGVEKMLNKHYLWGCLLHSVVVDIELRLDALQVQVC